jgi:hypothetical protein
MGGLVRRRIGSLVAVGVFGILTAIVVVWSGRTATPGVAEVVGGPGTRIVVFKAPSCRCCDRWETHLETAGFVVEPVPTADLAAKRREMGIPGSFESCHTAVVDGYFIEGHVPADVIIRLLKSRPAVAGLVVPGMPIGSPGMRDGPARPFQVYALDRSGKMTLYASR